ncbi:MAG: hypothetical protein PSV13_01430 [Lacunisphaera sp.]|nr:hypothetical protein [Lacunisphaera sp.]
MKPDPRSTPSDDDLDRLLARRYHDTSPEFEARWVALKRELRQAPPRARLLPAWRLTGWFGAVGALGAAAAIAFVMYSARPATSSSPELTPQVRELLALDESLGRALPLLDEETRTALLHLSASTPTSR